MMTNRPPGAYRADLLAQLRDPSTSARHWQRLMAEAADHIEALQEQLAAVADSDDAGVYGSAIEANHPSVDFEVWQNRARSVLGIPPFGEGDD